jgi:multicomponent Na+:H+ antiporter subunit G
VTIIGSVIIVLGATLTILAALGAWRFPTTLSRMHAATKAASLGLALVVVGSGVAASSPGIVGIGVLTSAFLFLTAPVSGHLLGRAAYLTGSGQFVKDDLSGVDPPRLELHPPARFDFSLHRWIGLIAVWALIWRDLSPGTLLAGAAIGLVLEAGRLSVAQPIPVKIGGLVRFAGYYLTALVRSNIQVALTVIAPHRKGIKEAIVSVPLPVSSPQAALLVANAITFTPGTLTVELSGYPPTLYAHVLQFEGEGPLRQEIDRLGRLAEGVFARR